MIGPGTRSPRLNERQTTMTIPSIKLADNTLERSELERLCAWIATEPRLTKGPLTEEFEGKFAQFLGSEHAVMVNSGSSANLIMVYALMQAGRLRNKTIIAPAISWVTTVSPAIQLGLDVHLCDCDTTTLGYDPEHFEQLCKEHRPSMAILVHVLGHAGQMDRLQDIADRYEVILIEDACEAFGSVQRGRHLGTIGAAGSFSFYYGHQMSTIEGGMVVMQDRELMNVARSLRAHGWARDLDGDMRAALEKEHNINELRSLYTFYYPGFNCRSSDLNAFLGITQLDKADDSTKVRERNFDRYVEALGSEFWVQSSDYDSLASFAFGTLVEDPVEVYQRLKAEGIETRPLICGNIGRQPFWIQLYGETRLQHADLIHDHGLYLPNHASLSEADVDRVTSSFLSVARPLESDAFAPRSRPYS